MMIKNFIFLILLFCKQSTGDLFGKWIIFMIQISGIPVHS